MRAIVKPTCLAVVVFISSNIALAAAADLAPKNVYALLSSTPQLSFPSQRCWTDVKLPCVAVKKTDVYGYINRSIVDNGTLSNGQEVLIVPILSGGTGGVFATLLFTRYAGKTRFVGYIPSPSGHLGVHVSEGRLYVVTPVYAVGDAQCCPHAHHTADYTLRGIRLVLVEDYGTR